MQVSTSCIYQSNELNCLQRELFKITRYYHIQYLTSGPKTEIRKSSAMGMNGFLAKSLSTC